MHFLPQTIPHPAEKYHIGNWKEGHQYLSPEYQVAMEIFILLRMHCYYTKQKKKHNKKKC